MENHQELLDVMNDIGYALNEGECLEKCLNFD